MSIFVFFISLLIVSQHVSGNHVPIIRSKRLRDVIASCWYVPWLQGGGQVRLAGSASMDALPANHQHSAAALAVPLCTLQPPPQPPLCAAVITKCHYVCWSYLISCNFCLLQACHDETSGRHRNSTSDGSQPRRQETNNTNRSFPFARFFYWKTVNDWFETGARNCGSLSPPAVCLIAFTPAWVIGTATTVRIFHVDLRSAQQNCWEGMGLGELRISCGAVRTDRCCVIEWSTARHWLQWLSRHSELHVTWPELRACCTHWCVHIVTSPPLLASHTSRRTMAGSSSFSHVLFHTYDAVPNWMLNWRYI